MHLATSYLMQIKPYKTQVRNFFLLANIRFWHFFLLANICP